MNCASSVDALRRPTIVIIATHVRNSSHSHPVNPLIRRQLEIVREVHLDSVSLRGS